MSFPSRGEDTQRPRPEGYVTVEGGRDRSDAAVNRGIQGLLGAPGVRVRQGKILPESLQGGHGPADILMLGFYPLGH